MSLHFAQGYINALLFTLQTCLCTSLRATSMRSSLLYRHVFALRSGLHQCAPLYFTDLSLHFAQDYINALLSTLQTCLCTSLRTTSMRSSLLYRHVFALRSGLHQCAPLYFTYMSLHFAQGYINALLSTLQTCLCTSLRATLMRSSLLYSHVLTLRSGLH
jgi:hypothetical protein